MHKGHFLAVAIATACASTTFGADLSVPTEFSTIQAAVTAAADGDTIHIAPGTYVEQVLIVDKDIALMGEPGAVIQSPANLVSIDTHSSGAPMKPVVGVSGGDVTIDGLVIDGYGTGGTNNILIGVFFKSASGMISNCTVRDTRHSPLNGVQGGLGIMVRNHTGSNMVRILNNEVVGFQKNGITANNLTSLASDLNVSINGNTVVGIGGTGQIAQNGIQVWGTTGELKRNKVRNIEYTGAGWVSCGILAFDPSGMTFEGNEVVNCQVGIYLAAYSTGPRTNHVVNNDVFRDNGSATYYYGMYLDGGSTNKVINNRISDVNAGIGYYATTLLKVIANRFVGLTDLTKDPVYDDDDGFGPSTQIRERATKVD